MCESHELVLRVPLMPMPISTPNFNLSAAQHEEATRGVPLDLWQCTNCGHVQVGAIGNPDLQYRDYVYTTSLSPGLPEHFRRYAAQIVERYALGAGSLVVEIGSNDGTLLSFFKEEGMRVLGVDPARKIADEATARGIPTLADFFSAELASSIAGNYGRADLIVANNVIANVPSLNDFGSGIAKLLAPGGVFVFETQYGPDVIEKTLLDTVYHEHISYFFAASTCSWLRQHGLEAIEVEHVATKGGSMRMAAQPRGSNRPITAAVDAWVAAESAKGAFGQAYFAQLGIRLGEIRSRLGEVVAAARARSREVAGFGVSVGTTALLPQFGLSSELAFLCDDDPNKAAVLRGPDYTIPVVLPDVLLQRLPFAVVIFAWRYADAIVKKHAAYLGRGGTFVVPLPEVRVIQS
jgi:SAM-dependent methyltransferase